MFECYRTFRDIQSVCTNCNTIYIDYRIHKNYVAITYEGLPPSISSTAIPNDLVYVVLNASKQKIYLRTKKAFKGLFPKLALILVVCLMHTKQEEEEAYHTIFWKVAASCTDITLLCAHRCSKKASCIYNIIKGIFTDWNWFLFLLQILKHNIT